MEKLYFSSSPHTRASADTKRVMLDVIIALVPSLIVGIYYFGFTALKVVGIAVGVSVVIEYFIQRFMMKKPTSIFDLSAVVTGILLAFNLPSNIPWWMIVIGATVAIAIAKMSFGGLGQNPFNPALVGRVFLLVSFPVAMTTWPVPQTVDGTTAATALTILKEGMREGLPMHELLLKLPSIQHLIMGNRGGCLGEVSVLALLIGGIYLLIRKVITWHIPVSFLLSSFLLASIMWLVDPHKFILPSYHLITGGIMLGAIYMATDMVTSPMSKKGMLIFGVGCGILTILIRAFGSYPEGVSFAILIMNAFTPLINKWVKARRFGENV